jgi:hypothetical protein
MNRATIALALTSALGCSPQADDDLEPLGALEYEHPYTRTHRLDRRIDIFYIPTMGEPERHECGLLSERAFGDLEDTLAALDPHVDYGYDRDVDECTTPPGAQVHIEGFEHSPFDCDFQCCRPELARAAVVYMLIDTYFPDGDVLEFDGEPYVVIEPDEPCP